MTTSTFTKEAEEFGEPLERIVLVDGDRLPSLRSEHGVGVSHRAVKIPKIDSDYFDE